MIKSSIMVGFDMYLEAKEWNFTIDFNYYV